MVYFSYNCNRVGELGEAHWKMSEIIQVFVLRIVVRNRSSEDVRAMLFRPDDYCYLALPS